jgi:peptidoglycan/LPS O-acetylase OafA/YrhL
VNPILPKLRLTVLSEAAMTSHGPCPTFSPAFSAYLDLLRGGSALAVAVSHLELFGIVSDGTVPFLPHNAHDAVVVFFVLSGLLVAFACISKPQQTLQGYGLDRASRILSVAVPVLLLSFCAAYFGLITPQPAYQLAKPYFYLPLFLGFLNQSWIFKEVPLNLYPWWSLPFEVFYYAVFGCALYLRGAWRLLITGGLFILMGPRLWLLFPVWLCGAAVMVLLHHRPSRQLAWFFAITPVLAFCTLQFFDIEKAIHYWTLIPWGYHGNARPFGNASYFLADYITGPLVAVHLYGMAHVMQKFPQFLEKPVRRFANVSFTLYLVHPLFYRVLTDSLALKNQTALTACVILGATILLCFMFAPFTEYQRKNWRHVLARSVKA